MGLSLIPVKHGDKRPALPRWRQYQGRQPHAKEIDDWFGDDGNRNIGVVCGNVSGGLFVVDFDSDGAFEHFTDKHRDSLTVQTSRGGHVYYRAENGQAPATARYPELDVIGEGSYVVAPPSIHRSGARYEFVGGADGIATVDTQAVVDMVVNA